MSRTIKLSDVQTKTLQSFIDAAKRFNDEVNAIRRDVRVYINALADVHGISASLSEINLNIDERTVEFSRKPDEDESPQLCLQPTEPVSDNNNDDVRIEQQQ